MSTRDTGHDASPEQPDWRRDHPVIRAFVGAGAAVAWWHRLEIEEPEQLPEAPALLVANHGFGGIFDLNGFAIAGILNERLPSDARCTILTHQLAWTVGIGPYLEPAGCRPANRDTALQARDAGHYVLVMPGGDLDAFKSFRQRNEVVFGNRTGFAGIAIETGVPIVPIVVSGAGETLLVLSHGRWLAQWLGLPERVRLKALPISLAIPYGLSIGMTGLFPYFPLPAKMRAAILDPIHAEPTETVGALAARVHRTMSAKLTAMTRGRIPFLGWRWPGSSGADGRGGR